MMLLALAGCAADAGPSLVADGLESMQTMLVLVEDGATVRGFAHPFAGAERGLVVDSAGAERVTVLFYAEPAGSLGIEHGPITFVDAGRVLPTPLRAFRMEVGGDDWQSVDALGEPLSELRLPPRVEDFSECVAPMVTDLALTSSVAAMEEVVTFLVARGPGVAIAGTNRGSLFEITSSAVTQLSSPGRQGFGGGWLQPGTSRLWVSRGLELATIDLDTRAVQVEVARLPGFVNRVVGTSGAGQPAELLLVVQETGAVLHYVEGGTRTTTLGAVPATAALSGDTRIAPSGPGRGWLTANSSVAYQLIGDPPTVRAERPDPDTSCLRGTPLRLTLATTWQGGPALARRCLRPRTNPVTMRSEDFDLDLLVRTPDDGWQPLPGGTFADDNMQSAAPLAGGLLLAGASSTFVRVLAGGGFCPKRSAAIGAGRELHLVHAAALDERTVVLTGPPKDGSDMTAPARAVVLRYPPR